MASYTPPQVRITMDDAKVQAAFAQFPDVMRQTTRAAVTEALAELEREVVARAPVAHGFLAGSIFSELRGTPADDVVQGVVAVNPPADRYALPVETGRKAGKRPPLDALLLWLESPKMKAVVFSLAQEIQQRRARARGRLQRVFRDVDAEELAETPLALEERRYKRTPEEQAKRDLAFMVQRKIGKEGTEGHFMFQDAFEENEQRVVEHIRGRLAAAAVTALGGSA